MIEQGFLKVNIEGFHGYLDKIGDIVDIFYEKNKSLPVNFVIQNHKVIIINPERYINRVEIDHKSIFLHYNKNYDKMEIVIEYFSNLIKDVFKSVKYKHSEFSRIGHAVHYIINDTEKTKDLLSKIFNTKNKVLVVNDTVFEIPYEEAIGIQKTISTPIDTLIGKQVFLINADYHTKKNEKIDNLKTILDNSIGYFKDKIFEGLYEESK